MRFSDQALNPCAPGHDADPQTNKNWCLDRDWGSKTVEIAIRLCPALSYCIFHKAVALRMYFVLGKSIL